MTLRDLIAADVSSVFLNVDDFAEPVTHWPCGRAAQAATVTAVFLPLDPIVDYERGEEQRTPAELHIADSVEVTADDLWIIGGEKWATDDVGKSEHGMRILKLMLVDRRLSTKARGNIL